MRAPKDILVKVPYLLHDPLYERQKPYVADFPVKEIPNATETNHQFDYIDLTIIDAQPRRSDWTLSQNGFSFLRAKTPLSSENAEDPLYVQTTFYNALEDILHLHFPEYERLEYLDHLVHSYFSVTSGC